MSKGISKRKPFSLEHRKKMSEAHIGKKLSLETRKKISEGGKFIHKEERHGMWKGDKVKYRALHQWVERWKGKSNVCEVCGTITAKKYDWANINHTYKRILEDYIRMCRSCHKKYDNEKDKVAQKK